MQLSKNLFIAVHFHQQWQKLKWYDHPLTISLIFCQAGVEQLRWWAGHWGRWRPNVPKRPVHRHLRQHHLSPFSLPQTSLRAYSLTTDHSDQAVQVSQHILVSLRFRTFLVLGGLGGNCGSYARNLPACHPQEDSDGRGLVIKIWSYAPNDRFGQEEQEWPFLSGQKWKTEKGGRYIVEQKSAPNIIGKTGVW